MKNKNGWLDFLILQLFKRKRKMGIYLYKPIPTANTFFKNKKLKLSVQWFSWKLSNCKNQGQIIKSLYFVNPEKLQVMTFSIQLTTWLMVYFWRRDHKEDCLMTVNQCSREFTYSFNKHSHTTYYVPLYSIQFYNSEKEKKNLQNHCHMKRWSKSIQGKDK